MRNILKYITLTVIATLLSTTSSCSETELDNEQLEGTTWKMVTGIRSDGSTYSYNNTSLCRIEFAENGHCLIVEGERDGHEYHYTEYTGQYVLSFPNLTITGENIERTGLFTDNWTLKYYPEETGAYIMCLRQK